MERTERICVETRGFTGGNLDRAWRGDGRRVVPAPSLDEIEATEPTDSDWDSMEDAE